MRVRLKPLKERSRQVTIGKYPIALAIALPAPNLSLAICQLHMQLKPCTHSLFATRHSNWVGTEHPCCLDDPCGRVPQYSGGASEIVYAQTLHRHMREVCAGSFSPHFVIDTSRNGNEKARAFNTTTSCDAWCNVRSAGLGRAATTATGVDIVDAFLWIKTPGQSDGYVPQRRGSYIDHVSDRRASYGPTYLPPTYGGVQRGTTPCILANTCTRSHLHWLLTARCST